MSESFGRGESALFLANPELASAARRQRFAEELLGQAVKPRNVGGHAGGLAQMGQALIAGYMGYREDEKIRALAEAQRANESEELRALMGGAMPAGQAVPATESALATPPGSLPPPVPIAPEGGEVPPMATALMNPPGQPPQAGGAAPAMPMPPPVPVGGPSPSAAPAMAQPGGMPNMDAIIAGMSSQSPRVRAAATALYQRANRQEDLDLRARDREEDRRFRLANRAPAAAAAPAASPMPFAGNSMDAQYNNIVLTLAPRIRAGTATPDEQAVYQRAFTALSEGQIQFVNDPTDPTGNRQVAVRVPRNMGDLPPPGGGQAPAAPQGMTAPVSQPGGPTGTVTPQGGAAVPATAQNDVLVVPTSPAAVPGFERMRAAPAGYQWRADGLIEPMPGGPADPRTQGLTEAQSRSNFFGAQMRMGDDVLRGLNVPSNAMLLAYRNLPSVPVNYGANANDQMYFNAARLFAAGVLRKETGAAMTPGEVLDVAERFFPTPFDRPQVIEQKARARQQIISSIAAELPGGQLRGELPSTTGPGGRGEASPPPRQPPPPSGFRIVQ